MLTRTLLACACLLIFSVDASEASERDAFRVHIAEARWAQASSYAHKYRWESGEIVGKRWLEMKTAGHGPLARFALLEFFWRQRLDGHVAKQEAASMRKDYLQLANQLDVEEADLAFTATTDKYFDRFTDEKVRSFSEPERQLALDELVEALKGRPEDIAVLMSLDIIARCSYAYGDKVDLSKVTMACTSPASKIMLAELVTAWGSGLRMEVRRPIIETTLPHLPNDEIRAVMLRKLLSSHTISATECADELMARYPRTFEARLAFGRKLSAVAAQDVADAEQLLGDSVDTLGMTPEELKSMKLTIVNAVGSDSSPTSEAKPEDIKAAKRILRSLSTDADPRFKGIVIDQAILFAERVGDEPLLTGLAIYRIKHSQPNDWHEVTPIIARHFMKVGEWEKAQHAWESWSASHGGCGSWAIFPSESRKVRIATCLLHQGKHEEAIRVIADAMTNPSVDSQIILPFLLFQIYDRAGQLDDFEKILSNLESDERLIAFRSRRIMGGDDEQRIELLQLPKHHWTVRGMLVVRSLAEEEDWQQLVSICQSYPGDYSDSTSSGDQLEFPLEHSIAIEAAKLLSESGAISVPSIRQAYQKYIDDPTGRSNDEFGDIHHEWVYQSLLKNKSPQAAELLQDLKPVASRTGVACFDPDQFPPEKLVNYTVLWPAPPEGKLPKTMPLNWPRNDGPSE